MFTIFLVLQVFIVIALIALVLLQKSDGGALGIGGGSGGGLMSGRGAANTLTRATSILGAIFMLNSLGLGIYAPKGVDQAEIARELTGDDNSLLAPDDGNITAGDLLEGFGVETDATNEAVSDDLLSLPVTPDATDSEGADRSSPAPEGESDDDSSDPQ
ncbi:preprotein translocase subunit SecG [Parvularcula sp. IMCC14364]|uniref:preprotein translocase subunit SecG n=1 Tax=Parvularcula sp. IMCC14364 TaxID=3067902 RepID=UPI002740AD3F|nr:preprotein translocase subunit SecG [Parvularcula sp. IMCC14364]